MYLSYTKHDKSGYKWQHQFFHIGFDPNQNSGRPQIFGGAWGLAWRFNIPHIRWNMKMNSITRFLYRWQSNILFRLDGRFKCWPGQTPRP
jgi:hypothetical protein